MSDETDVRIGKFDILATYTYAKALPDGTPANEAKERGIVAAIMGRKRSSVTRAAAKRITRQIRRQPRRRRKRQSLPRRSIIKSPTRWASSSIRPFFQP
jgi:hypothetical protein